MHIPIVAEETFVDHRLSCTQQEAAAKLLGWMRGCTRVVMLRSDDGGIVEEQLPYINSLEDSLEEMLSGYRNAASNALIDALNADEPFEEHCDRVEKYDAITRRANTYLRDIDEEISRGESSALRLDPKATAVNGEPCITIASLARWSLEKYGIDIDMIDDAPLTNFSVTSTNTSIAATTQKAPDNTHGEHTVADKPWLTPVEGDPPAEQPWYIPARYFARELIKADTNLLLKREVLAGKVGTTLAKVGIYKRGGKKPIQSSTILKAFVNLKF